jgi:anti-anti-sigma factor
LGLTTTTSSTDDRVIVRVTGELDLGTVPQFLVALDDAIEDAPTHIELDLGQLGFMDSSGVGAYVDAFRRARSRGMTLAIGERSAAVDRVLELSGVEDALAQEAASD